MLRPRLAATMGPVGARGSAGRGDLAKTCHHATRQAPPQPATVPRARRALGLWQVRPRPPLARLPPPGDSAGLPSQTHSGVCFIMGFGGAKVAEFSRILKEPDARPLTALSRSAQKNRYRAYPQVELPSTGCYRRGGNHAAGRCSMVAAIRSSWPPRITVITI